MPNVATPIEVRQVGLAKESVRGTPEAAPSSFVSLTKDSDIEFSTKLIEDPALRGVNARFPSFPGLQEGKGPLKTPARAQNIGEFLHMLFGPAASSTEQDYITVTLNTNDYIDFVVGAGSEVHAQIAAGTYKLGTTSATNGSYLKAIKTAMEAVAGGSTYTITLSNGNMVITQNSSTFTLKFGTGTNKAKSAAAGMGFSAADTSAALAQTGTLGGVLAPYKHLFTSGQVTQLPSYSFYIDRGAFSGGSKDIKVYNLGSMQKLKLSSNHDGPVEMEANLMAQQEASYGGAWSPVFNESPVLMFNHSVVKFAGSAPSVPMVKSWSCELNPGMKEYRPLSQQQYAYDFLAAGPFDGQGDLVVYFMDQTERAKFLAATETSLEFLIAGSAIGNSLQKYTLDILLPSVKYEAFPFGEQDGFLAAAVKWQSRYSAASTFAAQAYLINTKSSY